MAILFTVIGAEPVFLYVIDADKVWPCVTAVLLNVSGLATVITGAGAGLTVIVTSLVFDSDPSEAVTRNV